MKTEQLERFKNQLLELRARCNGDVSQLANEAFSSDQSNNGNLSNVPIHMADVGSDNFEKEFTLSLMENEGEVIERIDVALDRIASQNYGKCAECDGKIPLERLKAIPYTVHCVECARMLETQA